LTEEEKYKLLLFSVIFTISEEEAEKSGMKEDHIAALTLQRMEALKRSVRYGAIRDCMKKGEKLIKKGNKK